MGITKLTSSSLLAFLVATVASTQGQGTSVHRGPEACRFVFMSCSRQLETVIERIEAEGQVPDVNNLCSVARQAQSCMGDCIHMLDNEGTGRAINGVISYVCDDSNKAEVEQALKAKCFEDGTMEREFESKSEACVQEHLANRLDSEMKKAFSRGVYDVEQILCPLVEDVMVCIDGEVKDMCGEEMIPIVNKIFTIVLREMLSEQMPTCFEQVNAAHSVMKRAVSYLKTLRK